LLMFYIFPPLKPGANPLNFRTIIAFRDKN